MFPYVLRPPWFTGERVREVEADRAVAKPVDQLLAGGIGGPSARATPVARELNPVVLMPERLSAQEIVNICGPHGPSGDQDAEDHYHRGGPCSRQPFAPLHGGADAGKGRKRVKGASGAHDVVLRVRERQGGVRSEHDREEPHKAHCVVRRCRQP